MARTLQEVLDIAGNAESDSRADQILSALTEGEMSSTEIETLLAEAVEKFNALNASDDASAPESMTGLELLADVIVDVRTAQETLETQAAETQMRRDELAAKVSGETEKSEDGDENAPGDGELTDSPAPAEAVVDETPAEEAAPEAVAASAAEPRRYNLSRIQGKAPEPKPTKDPSKLVIVASADVRGFAQGSELDGMNGLVAAATAKIETMPKGIEGVHVRAGYASIKVQYPDALIASGSNDDEVVRYAANPALVKDGQGLAAAGGWCAPSETLYDLAPLLADPNTGLVDLPDIQVKRGGLRTTEGADFTQIWAGNVGLIQTETQAEAGTEKALYRVPCTTFAEVRADVIYTGVEAGILQDHAYPELTRQHVEGALTAHAHKVNMSSIARMVAQSTAVDLTTTLGPSAAGSLLNGIELQIVDYRYSYRAPETMTLEVVLPVWAKAVLRSDLALRAGDGNIVQVTDQQIDAFFAARGARVQWVVDWQDAFSGVAAGFGGATAITAFPATVNALVYAAGTFVRGRGEVVNLEAVYDSTNIKVNDFLRLFVEEKLLVHRRQYKSRNVSFSLGVRGATGAAEVLDGNGKVAV